MSWQQVPMHEFPGLDLRRSPDTPGIALDAWNVDFEVDGTVGTRPGITRFSTTTPFSYPTLLAPYLAQSQLLVASNGTGMDALDTSGALVAGEATLGEIRSVVPFGTSTVAEMYIADPGSTVRKWDGASFSQPSGMPRASFVAVTPWDNRLVAARAEVAPGGSGPAGPATVYFSDAGEPESWTNDGAGGTPHIHLSPGDGDAISAALSWRDYVFIFKGGKFFVFYGTTPNTDGSPIFDYRAVDAGLGCFHGAAVAARDGVYFLNREGVWRTTGGVPEKVSTPLDPWVLDGSLPFWQGPPPSLSQFHQSHISYADGRLFFHASAAEHGYVAFVYDIAQRKWSAWGGSRTMPSCSVLWRGDIYLGLYGPARHVYRLDPSATDDDTSEEQAIRNIGSRYRTGFYDLGVDTEKRIRGANVWGTGNVDFALSADFDSTVPATSLTLGADPAIARQFADRPIDGTVFSHQFSADAGRWRVHRCALEVEGARLPGTDTP